MWGHVKLNWVYRGLQGFLDIKKSQKPKFYFMDDKRKLMYPDLIDMSAPAHAFAIKNDVTTRENIHSQFEKRAANVLSQYRTNSGKRNWQKLDAKVLKFHLFEDQLASCQEAEDEIASLQNDVEEWKAAHANLEGEKKLLLDEMQNTIKNVANEIGDLKATNSHLEEYIKCLEKEEGIAFKGKTISEIQNKQRTLKAFLSRAETALWFSKAFGLELESLKVKETDTGKTHDITAEMKAGKPGENPTSQAGSDADMSRIETILYLLDKFCVSDEFYHELSMIENGIPRSYLIKQCRNNLDKLCHVKSTPGTYEGAQISFESLLSQQISAFMKENTDFDFANETLKIKISGDGAKMTKKSNYILLSCALLQKKDEVMAAKGNHTIAVVNGSEKYETLQVFFKDIFSEVNSFIKLGFINVDGRKIYLEFFLGGDYKFLLTVMGLKGATSLYACLWCIIHKDRRWETDKHFLYFNTPPMMRTLKKIKDLVKEGKGDYCCVKEPLLDIDLDHVVVDELHLLLRVMDIMLDNIITEVITWDKQEDWEKPSMEPKGVHLKKLVTAIRSCGVGFDVWEVRNPTDNKGTGKYEFTSLFGNDKKKILSSLPEKLPKVLLQDTCHKVSKVWVDFRGLYEEINAWSDNNSVDTFANKTRDWLETFLSLRGKRTGYERKRITPYMHVLFAHVPFFLDTYKSLKIFTGQGVEKNNDTARNVVHRKTNHYDSVGHILRIENRQWLLRERERTSRKYSKQNNQYWEQEICIKRAGKKRQPEESVCNIGDENSTEEPQSQECNHNNTTSAKRQRQTGGRGRGKGRQKGKQGPQNKEKNTG